MVSTSDLLEAANGVWAILAFWLAGFLAYHLIKVRAQRHIPWTWFYKMPLSMQLAMGILVTSVAIFSTRIIIWWSRFENDGILKFQSTETVGFVIATFLGIIGFLCILRTVTRPILGHIPWTAALFNVIGYIIWWAWLRL